MERHPFGRRAAQPAFSRVIKTPSPDEPYSSRSAAMGQVAFASDTQDEPSVDEELREWKAARRKNIRLPWRQISFMASICFGTASLVLPASVNDLVQWPLLALGALSLIACFSMRGKSPR